MKHYGRKAAVVLLLSLVLAGVYVEYGKSLKAPEGEKAFGKNRIEKMENETETETEAPSGLARRAS